MTDHPTPERAAPDQRVATHSGADVAFGDLICADTGLLHVEFEAITAANFPVGDGQPSRRPRRRSRPVVADRPRRPARRPLATTAASPASSAPAGGAQRQLSRQRSPPGDNQATESTATCQTRRWSPPEHVGPTRAPAGRSPRSHHSTAQRAPGTHIGCSASTAHHAGDLCQMALVAGRDDRLD